MTAMQQPSASFETRAAKDADPATAALAEDIARARGTDYFLMKDQLTDQENEIMYKVRAFGEAEVLPIVNDYWERGEFPFQLIPKLAALNIVGDHNLGDYGCTPMSAVANGSSPTSCPASTGVCARSSACTSGWRCSRSTSSVPRSSGNVTFRRWRGWRRSARSP